MRRTFLEITVDDEGEFQLAFRKDFVKQFFSNPDEILEHIDYDALNELKDMITDSLKNGDIYLESVSNNKALRNNFKVINKSKKEEDKK